MKKLKALKGALIGIFVVAAACCVFVACGSGSDEDDGSDVKIEYIPIDNSSIVSMTLDDTSAKKTYLTYQSFSSEGLEATAIRESGAVEVMAASELDIDYSSFDNATAGIYTIKVAYVENEYSFAAEYEVEVVEEIVGLKITKDTVDYNVETIEGATISLDDMKVYSVDGDGGSSQELDGGEYELKYYKGGEEISSLSGLTSGIYTIYAYRDVTISGQFSTIKYECGAYILCYAIDTLLSISFVSGTTTQELGVNDEMTGTWTYLLTYGSGLTKTLTAKDVVVTGVNTLSGTKGDDDEEDPGAAATVTYTETMVSSTAHNQLTISASVTYYISMPTGSVVYIYSLNFGELASAASYSPTSNNDNKQLASGYFTGNNAFISYTGPGNTDNDRLRYQSNSICMETKGEVLEVVFMGTGSITVSFSSTGSTNWSNLGLITKDGYYLKASEMQEAENLNEHEMENGRGFTYEVYNTTAYSVTYTVEEPGAYIIATNVQDFSDKMGAIDRPTRFRGIEMTDIYEPGESDGNENEDENTLEIEMQVTRLTEGLDLMDIDLSLPQNTVVFSGVGNSKKD